MAVSPEPAANGWQEAFLGRLYFLANCISWHIPVAYLAHLVHHCRTFHLFDPAHYVTPVFHWFSGAAMIGAFFILTDPVSSPTTHKGKLIFAVGAALITYLIRVFGGFPDGMAFATLLMNICVPLIDAYTQPKVFGKRGKNHEAHTGQGLVPCRAQPAVLRSTGHTCCPRDLPAHQGHHRSGVAKEKLKLIAQIVPHCCTTTTSRQDTFTLP